MKKIAKQIAANRLFLVLLIGLTFIVSPRTAHAYLDPGTGSFIYAYLDPGTGSLIVQMIIAALATGAFSVKLFWKKIKTKLNNLFGSSKVSKKDDQK